MFIEKVKGKQKNTLVVSKVHSSTPVSDVLMYLLSHNVALEAFKM